MLDFYDLIHFPLPSLSSWQETATSGKGAHHVPPIYLKNPKKFFCNIILPSQTVEVTLDSFEHIIYEKTGTLA